MNIKNKILIYADLNREEKPNKISLNTIGTTEGLKKNNISFSEGATLWFWSDDKTDKREFDPFIFPLRLSYDKNLKIWFGEFKKEELKHYSDFLEADDHSWDEIVKNLR